ncbi:MAG: ABC transporter ATP-binding protein [Ectothiorhodospiraceae bacterium]|nr:ABC transporter ATP-binding protein [Ectothiorhodospiraceae bacterium]
MTLELNGVVKRVGREVHIHETDLTLEPGAFNILLGTTLAGKTTLMRIMAGLERPTAGAVRVDGRDVTGVPVRKRNVSMVYQQFINYPNLDVFENIASPLRVARRAEAEVRSRVGRVAELLRLTPYLRRRPAELSGGQQQRTALARALVKDAELVLLDEPLANLDYKLREELRDELPRLLSERGVTVVYATSEPTEALLLGGHTATLHEGRVTQHGETREVHRAPVDLTTARVFSDPPLNTASVRKAGATVHLSDRIDWPALGAAGTLPDGYYTVGIRPYHLTPRPLDGDAVAMTAHVLVAELSGSESIVHARLGDSTWVSQSHGVHAVAVGSDETFFMHPGRCLYFDAAGRRVGG